MPGLGFRDEVLLPVTELKWTASQPDEVLNVYEAFSELDQAKWNVGGEHMIFDPWNGMIFKRNMTVATDAIVRGLVPEMAVAFDKWFGGDSEEWKEIKVMPAIKLVVAQGSTSFTCGLPLG